ncbi:aromatic hydrocarbon degradation protein [Thiocapsa imhoffii]|uniref:Aromatic hydrocarbon degradation protein n=1 Tax=Thiocapsa imhoffii TaxID=382777 RepID=A0A9X0WHR2_9GAMM|nr:porin [Thiocapsa imhoffii]MBK1644954.1 aromatic hydrocarbon degradation protein [Thiocapsa imhoffii]
MSRWIRHHSITRLTIASMLLAPTSALASGFSLPEASSAGVGLANALVANPDEIGAFAYNPAAMGFHERSSVALGSLLIGPNFSVTTASGQHDSQGAAWVAAPIFYSALKIDERWRFGLGLSAPFGLETRWADGTFPALSGTVRIPVPPPLDPEVPRGHPTTSKLEILDLAPSLAYRVDEHLSLAFGLDIYWVKTAQLDSTTASLIGDGADLGFNASLLYRAQDWSVGAAFRSGATIGLEGDYQPWSPTLVAIGRLPPAERARVDLNLPWRLQLGVRYRFTDALAAEFDWTRTGWSAFNRLEIKGQRLGNAIFSDTNAWRDANAYRFGLTYQIRPQTGLRFGYSYDETGQRDDHFSARVPDNDRQLFGLGFVQQLGQGFSVEAGYLYVKAKERSYRSTKPSLAGDINGTSALNGDYKMDAHLVGLEISKVF